jgi:hypothetical protein
MCSYAELVRLDKDKNILALHIKLIIEQLEEYFYNANLYFTIILTE